ncbi:MAG: HlyD family efflux transporter periplasmic adaptor subunit [Candidatus Neomarinimicrobiota bacterium]
MHYKKSTILKILSFFLILIIGVAGMNILGSSKKQTQKRDIVQEVRKVETQLLTNDDVQIKIEGNGTIEAQKMVDIVSEVQGIVTFAKNDLKSGTHVKSGELICKIDPRQAENSYQSQYAEFTRVLISFLAFANLESEELYDKWSKYFDEIDIKESIKDLPEITDPRERNQAISNNVFTQYYAVKNAEIALSKHSIFAPFDGYITSNGIIKDSYVNFGQKLVSLQDVTNIDISVPLLLEDAQWIDFTKNPKVKVFWENDSDSWTYGKIYRKENQLNRNSQSINVFVSLNNENLNQHLFPGNYVRVLIEGVTIPNVAIIPRNIVDNDNQIYFVDDSSKLGRTRVNIIAVQGDMVLIEKLLSDSTKIVTSILQKPLIGMPIEDVNTVNITIDTTATN